MIKYTFEMEDVSGTIESLGNGKYLLSATENGEAAKKEITSEEAAAILFCSFDEFTSDDAELTDVFQTARIAMKDFPIQLIP